MTTQPDYFPPVQCNSKTQFKFNPHRYPLTLKAQDVIGDVTRRVQGYEHFYGLRQRARKQKDQDKFEQMMTAIISDLCYRYCQGPENKVYLSRSKQQIGRVSRYMPKVIGKTLPTILDILATPDLELIGMEKGHKLKGKQTTIWPGVVLVSMIERSGITWRDFDESGTSEVIQLRGEREGRKKGKLLEYLDTPETQRFRQEMERINKWLVDADITFDTSSCTPQKGPVNSKDRTLRRIFNNGSFAEGGRLYGGFWQEGLRKEERTKGIRIGGERTVSLDYSQVCPRILYGMARVEPRSDDLYTVPQLESNREGLKKVLVSLLFAKDALLRTPRNARPLLPKRMKFAEVVRLIELAHPDLVPYFGTGIGMELMFQESQILVEVLLTLIDHGVVALPVHDAVVVREADEEITRKVMDAVFRKHTGLSITVKAE